MPAGVVWYDVDFGKNQLNPGEGFNGTEDTLNRTAFGLTALMGRLFDPR